MGRHLIRLLPNTDLTDDIGNTYPFHDLIRGKTIVLNMFYSRCDVKCVPLGKLMLRVYMLLKGLDERERADIQFVSISLDPANDRLEDLCRFRDTIMGGRGGDNNGSLPNWHFYTGDAVAVDKLRHKLGMYSPEPEIDRVKANHSGAFMIFNDETGFVKHTKAFDNPLDIARKVVQTLPAMFRRHAYSLNNLNYDALTQTELFENIQTLSSVFTVPFLPDHILKQYETEAERQRGFCYVPPIGGEPACCCGSE
jgi:cytochrome oxidase Cu insertion factor (SCO1/SenC/PrrC family)